MKKIAIIAALLVSMPALADTYVNPYVRSDGTFVQGHMRSDANSTTSDNYSTKGNTNPYTGERGTKSPEPTYTPPAYEPVKPWSPPNPYGK